MGRLPGEFLNVVSRAHRITVFVLLGLVLLVLGRFGCDSPDEHAPENEWDHGMHKGPGDS
jgi:hypothetical protein